MGVKLNATEKRIIYLIHLYEEPVPRTEIHRAIRLLMSKGARFKLRFYDDYSPELDEELRKLSKKGYLRELYMAGPGYTSLYIPYYKVGARGVKVVEKLDIDKKDMKLIESTVSRLKKRA
ncbi:MAG: hypothetical protein DRJ43_03815 [Thermoprotei archaeon]|nr:MAG: hypothetical protein DRJ43_03815 [Thermoprotei archaeon]HDI31968.1 hypothetical protein [Thermofilum sp.]